MRPAGVSRGAVRPGNGVAFWGTGRQRRERATVPTEAGGLNDRGARPTGWSSRVWELGAVGVGDRDGLPMGGSVSNGDQSQLCH